MSDGDVPDGDPPGDRHRSIPVQGIRPGDHAFTAYGSEAGQWAVLSAFVRQGLISGEKVLLFLPPEVTGEELLRRLEPRTPTVVGAWTSGRLVLTSMRSLIHPDRGFTAERQWQRLIEEAELAAQQGYSATRAYIDMAWVADMGVDVCDVLRRERESAHLFDGSLAYSEVCAYDERAFAPDTLDELLRAHPRQLLDALGSLHAVHGTEDASDGENTSENGSEDTVTEGPARHLRLIGEADVTTCAEFRRALRTALAEAPATGRPRLTVDLTALHFLGVGCAADLLRLSAEAGAGAGAGNGATGATEHPESNGNRREEAAPHAAHLAQPVPPPAVGVTVNCTPFQARTLRHLGADSISTLTLTVEGANGC